MCSEVQFTVDSVVQCEIGGLAVLYKDWGGSNELTDDRVYIAFLCSM